MTFPYQLYSKINGYTGPTQPSSNYANPVSGSHFTNICRKIASSAIKSAKSDNNQVVEVQFPKFAIPKELLIYGSIIAGKMLLFAIYQKASKNGLSEALDI